MINAIPWMNYTQNVTVMSDLNAIKNDLKVLIVESLNLEDLSPADIGDRDTLFGEGIGLDSIDALELGMAISKRYQIKLSKDRDENTKHFKNVEALATLILELTNKWSKMTRQEINKMVIDTLKEAFDLSVEDLAPNAKLYEDLDLDSLDAIDLAVKLKNDTGLTLDEDEMRSLVELSDLMDLLEKKINISHPDVS